MIFLTLAGISHHKHSHRDAQTTKTTVSSALNYVTWLEPWEKKPTLVHLKLETSRRCLLEYWLFSLPAVLVLMLHGGSDPRIKSCGSENWVGDAAGINFSPLRHSLELNAYVIHRQIWLDEKPPLRWPVPAHLYIVSENGVFCTIFARLGGFLISFKVPQRFVA